MKTLETSHIVIKLGTNVVTKINGTGDKVLDRDLLRRHVRRIVDHITTTRDQITLVTSGAVAMGREVLKKNGRVMHTSVPDLDQKMMAAKVGQPALMGVYDELLMDAATDGDRVVDPTRLLVRGQLLPYTEDLRQEKIRANLLDHMSLNKELGVIDIVNANDPISPDQLQNSDNDELAAEFAKLLRAELMVLLTDVDGICTANPKTDPDARLVDFVWADELHVVAPGIQDDPRFSSNGGMKSKPKAARNVSVDPYCIPTIIANGKLPNVIADILNGRPVGTLIMPRESDSKFREPLLRAWNVTA